jgi:xylan 1,4-beta-xylosidase
MRASDCCLTTVRFLLLFIMVYLGLSSGIGVHAQSAGSTPMIEIDAHAASHPFPHFWEQMFGSGRAILSLRESYRHDLRETKRITGFEYVRFHAIFQDEVGVYDEDMDGKPVYNFSYVDQIYGFCARIRRDPHFRLLSEER